MAPTAGMESDIGAESAIVAESMAPAAGRGVAASHASRRCERELRGWAEEARFACASVLPIHYVQLSVTSLPQPRSIPHLRCPTPNARAPTRSPFFART